MNWQKIQDKFEAEFKKGNLKLKKNKKPPIVATVIIAAMAFVMTLIFWMI